MQPDVAGKIRPQVNRASEQYQMQIPTATFTARTGTYRTDMVPPRGTVAGSQADPGHRVTRMLKGTLETRMHPHRKGTQTPIATDYT